MRRVVITGVGVVSPLGLGRQATAEAYAAGGTCVGVNTVFDSRGFGQSLSGEAPSFDPRAFFRTPKAMKLCDRGTRLAVVASSLALADASLEEAPDRSREQLGVIVGTSGSDLGVPELARALDGLDGEAAAEGAPAFAHRVLGGLNPLWLLVNLPNMSSAHVAMQANARGPNSTIMTDWIAGLQAIGEACDLVRTGEADCVLAGGADTGVMPMAYAAFAQEGRFVHGFVPAEAAVMLAIEERAHARARDARILADVLAFGCARATGLPRAERLASDVCGRAGWREPADTLCVALSGIDPASLDSPGTAITWTTSGAVIDASPHAGHALAAAAPLSLACALTATRPGRVLAWQTGRGKSLAALALSTVSREESLES